MPGPGSQRHSISFFEPAHRPLGIPALFAKCFGVPFATIRSKEVAPINVNGGGHAWYGVRDRMNNVTAQRLNIALAECLCASGFSRPGARRQKMLSSRPV